MSKKGFTLMEVLVAVWIIGTTLVAIVGLNIGNIKFSKNIDEISQAIFILYDARMRGYLQAKYNAEIPPIDYPEKYKMETEIFDLSTIAAGLPFLSDINLTPVPIAFVKTPSEKKVEMLGISYYRSEKTSN